MLDSAYFLFAPFPNLNFTILFNSSPPTVFVTFVGTEDVIVPTIILLFDCSAKAPPLIGVFKILFLRRSGTAPPTKSLLFPVEENPFILFPEVVGTYRELGIIYIFYVKIFMGLLGNHQSLSSKRFRDRSFADD